MRYKILIQAFVFGLTAIMLSGCFPDNDMTYDGPLQVEFKPTSDTQSMSDGVSYSAHIQLIGPHQNEAITVYYEVDTENSTAVEGEHFELGDLTSVIPANSSFGSIEINAIKENIDDSQPVLYLRLIDSDQLRAARNYDTLELTLRP